MSDRQSIRALPKEGVVSLAQRLCLCPVTQDDLVAKQIPRCQRGLVQRLRRGGLVQFALQLHELA